MEVKKLDYQYMEVDPYKKPDWLLEINPRGLIPALRHGDWNCYESTVLMEYVSLHSWRTEARPSLTYAARGLEPRRRFTAKRRQRPSAFASMVRPCRCLSSVAFLVSVPSRSIKDQRD